MSHISDTKIFKATVETVKKWAVEDGINMSALSRIMEAYYDEAGHNDEKDGERRIDLRRIDAHFISRELLLSKIDKDVWTKVNNWLIDIAENPQGYEVADIVPVANPWANEPKVPYGREEKGATDLGRWETEAGYADLWAAPVTTADEPLSRKNAEHFNFDVAWSPKGLEEWAVDEGECITFHTLVEMKAFRDCLSKMIDHLEAMPKIGDGPAIG